MKKTYLINLLLLALLQLLGSCNNLDQAPTDKFTDETYWTSTEKAMSVLSMAYNQMYNADIFFRTEALSDNMYERRTHDERIISSGQANAATARFAEDWQKSYAGIKTCHTFLENVDRVSGMDPDLKARAKAEARFIRAWLFFRLTTWYGDVPLFTHDISLSESKSITRTPHAEVVSFICTELEEIAELLPTNKEYAAADRGRITCGAALALKARVHLFDSDWANCAATCERLLGSNIYGEYALHADFAQLFTVEGEYSKEDILSLQYVPLLRTWSDYQDFIPPSVRGRVNKMAPTQELVEDFVMLNGKHIREAGSGYNENTPYLNRDPRMDMTIVRHLGTWDMPDGTVRTIYTKPGTAPDASARADEYNSSDEKTSPTGYYLKKYYDKTGTNSITSGMNIMLLRWADVLLMYAEAKNELGEMNATVWNATIKALRQRTGFTDAAALDLDTSLTQLGLQTVIRRERRCETVMEGLRVFDIRRWRIAELVLNGRPHGDKFENSNTEYIVLEQRVFDPERDYLWPVPQSEKDINPNLGQNPKY
jgi:hypothetical protein